MVLSPLRLNTFITDLSLGSEITKMRKRMVKEENDRTSERETEVSLREKHTPNVLYGQALNAVF